MDSQRRKCEVGNFVWSKLGKFSPWPSQVTTPLSSMKPPKNSKLCICVYFFGSKNFGWVSEDCIWPYEENKKRFSSNANISLQKAIADADDCMELSKKARHGNERLYEDESEDDSVSSCGSENVLISRVYDPGSDEEEPSLTEQNYSGAKCQQSSQIKSFHIMSIPEHLLAKPVVVLNRLSEKDGEISIRHMSLVARRKRRNGSSYYLESYSKSGSQYKEREVSSSQVMGRGRSVALSWPTPPPLKIRKQNAHLTIPHQQLSPRKNRSTISDSEYQLLNGPVVVLERLPETALQAGTIKLSSSASILDNITIGGKLRSQDIPHAIPIEQLPSTTRSDMSAEQEQLRPTVEHISAEPKQRLPADQPDGISVDLEHYEPTIQQEVSIELERLLVSVQQEMPVELGPLPVVLTECPVVAEVSSSSIRCEIPAEVEEPSSSNQWIADLEQQPTSSMECDQLTSSMEIDEEPEEFTSSYLSEAISKEPPARVQDIDEHEFLTSQDIFPELNVITSSSEDIFAEPSSSEDIFAEPSSSEDIFAEPSSSVQDELHAKPSSSVPEEASPKAAEGPPLSSNNQQTMFETASILPSGLPISHEFHVPKDYDVSDNQHQVPVGILGIGQLGKEVTEFLLQDQCNVTIWNRTPSKCEEFRRRANIAKTIEDLVHFCDIIFICVASSEDVFRQVFYHHIFACSLAGKSIVVLTSLHPNISLDVSELVQKGGGQYLESPATRAAEIDDDGRSLILLCVGAKDLFLLCCFYFEIFTQHAYYYGGYGKIGSACQESLILNAFQSCVIAGCAEVLELSEKAKIPMHLVTEIIVFAFFRLGEETRLLAECLEKANAILHNAGSQFVENLCQNLSDVEKLSDDVKLPIPVIKAAHELLKRSMIHEPSRNVMYDQVTEEPIL